MRDYRYFAASGRMRPGNPDSRGEPLARRLAQVAQAEVPAHP